MKRETNRICWLYMSFQLIAAGFPPASFLDIERNGFVRFVGIAEIGVDR